MLRLRAKTILNPGHKPLDNAAVLIKTDGTIEAVGQNKDFVPSPGEEQVDLGECLLIPGLINTHCHLDYTMMRGAFIGTGSFADWIARINSLKRNLSLNDYRQALHAGIRESLAQGTTSLVNIEAYLELVVDLPPTPLRIWWCLELMDVRLRNASEDFCLGLMRACEPGHEHQRHRFGLSPHAPYTTSRELYQAAAEVCSQQDLLFTSHISESSDEIEMFALGSGSLFELIQKVGGMNVQSGNSPLSHLTQPGALPERALLVHMNGLSESDYDWLAAGAQDGQLSVAHCPQSHEFFGHPQFDADRLRELGVNICLGTDSLASSQSLSLFDEMACFAKNNPGWSPAEIFRLVTVNAAHALGQGDSLGQLAPGFQADLVAIPCEEMPKDPYEALLNHTGQVLQSWIGGQPVPARNMSCETS